MQFVSKLKYRKYMVVCRLKETEPEESNKRVVEDYRQSRFNYMEDNSGDVVLELIIVNATFPLCTCI